MRSRRVLVATLAVLLCALSSNELEAQVSPRPQIVTVDSVNLPEPCLGAFPCFLTRKFLPNPTDPNYPANIVVDPNSNANVAPATRYYQRIGAFRNAAAGGASTLTNFKIKNQFVLSDGSTPRNGGFRAFYFNNGDLQLGREMHCNQSGEKIACYVSNYGPPPFPAGNTVDNNTVWPNSGQALSEVESVALNSPNAAHPFATVAMEYLGKEPTAKANIPVTEADGVTQNLSPPKFCAANYSGNQPPSNADVDTGIDVETGDVISITASGLIWAGYCFTGRNTADGYANQAGPGYPLETGHEQALIGRVGNASYFELGSGPNGQFALGDHLNADPPGRLFLRTNDNNPGNGSGSFSVTVTIKRPQRVRFYVYGANGALVKTAALDTEGNKLVPQMCMACHGGTYNDATDEATNSSFLPFDVFSFSYSQKPGLTLNDQQEQFRQLNLIVKNTDPNPIDTNNPIGNLIDALYDNKVGVFQQTATVPQPPPGTWQGHETLYRDFVAHYCRTCHFAQDQRVDFTTFAGFSGSAVGGLLCSGQMPHAQVPFYSLANTRIGPVVANDLRAIGLPCLVEEPLKRLGSPKIRQ